MKKQILNYHIVIEKEHYEDRSLVYSAHCPTLDVHDYGDTVEKVMKSIKDGMLLAIEALKSENKEVPTDRIEDHIITSTQIEIPHTFAAAP